jgi:hypothetical protein
MSSVDKEIGTEETRVAFQAAEDEAMKIDAEASKSLRETNYVPPELKARLREAKKKANALYEAMLAADDKRIDNDEVVVGSSRRRRTRRRHTRRRRGGHSDLKTRKKGMVKALLKEARNQKERSVVMSRVHKQGMEMLARKAALRAKYSS